MAEAEFGPGDFKRYLTDLEIGGLRGRLWRAPPLKSAAGRPVFVVVYGHHSSLERSAGLAQYLRRFGRVLMPDLPGFGGMDSFYRRGERPSVDNYAHYLEEFLAGHCKAGRPISLIGFSFGFLVVTRLLQLYPGRRKDVRLLCSLTGFLDGRSLSFSPARRFWCLRAVSLIGSRGGSLAFRYLVLNGWALRRFYSRILSARGRFAHFPPERRRRLMEVEIRLWRINDIRTWAFTAGEMIRGDLSRPPLGLDLHHVFARGDHFLDNRHNNERLRLVYNRVELYEIDLANHAPTVVASPEEVEALMPPELAAVLEEKAFMKKKLPRR